jgi:Rps23 Pro-64 3,4-dihydroxylase Tpa1-like proline 4-hydroxylase
MQSVRVQEPDGGMAGRTGGSFVSLNGVRLDSDELLDAGLLAGDSVRTLHDRFAQARPFRHLVLEGLFAPRLLECVDAEFSAMRGADWERYDNRNERKMGTRPSARLGPASQLYFDLVHSRRFVDFLGRVSGIDGLVTDPMLCGGGLHKIPAGGRFAVHLDFNKHPVTRLDNRLVFITYLNRDWKKQYGGALQLWDADTDSCAAEILPVFGRSVLLNLSSRSLHGHPDPVRAPDGRTRRSVAAYFYSNGRDDERVERDHTTIIARPITMGRYARVALGVKYWTPPALIDAFRLITRRQWS